MKKYILNLFLLSAVLSVAAQQFTINGNTTQLSCECYQLTSNNPSQGGSAWNNNQINLTNSFDYHFRVFLGCNDNPGADGICFILQNTNTGVFTGGGGLGFANFPNQSIGIELDTHQNGGFGDPAEDHVGMGSNGNIAHNLVAPVQASAVSANIEDCQWHDFHVVWDAPTNTITVSFDGVQRFTYTFAGGLVNSIFLGNPNVYWGWTGATGAEYNIQQFCLDIDAEFTGGTNNAYCGISNVPFTSSSQSGLNSIVGYAWDFGDGSPVVNTQNPSHTFPNVGTYNVTLTITDQSLCTNTQTYPVVIHPIPQLSASQTDALCNGSADGTATVSVTGGTAQPYTITWSPAVSNISPNGPTTFTGNGLTAGTYTATVTDANTCSATAQNIINEPTALTVTTSHTDVNCFGGNDGTLTLTVSGGTAPYSYLGNNVPAGTTTIPGLVANTYAGNITDAHGCTAAVNETISQPSAPLSQTATQTNPTCYQGSDGTITVTAAGGTSPYGYVWNPNVSNSNTATGLASGGYTVTVTDNHNCTNAATYTLVDPAPMQLSETHVDEPCNGDASGSITITVNGGTPSFTYAWSPNVSSGATGTGLTAGTYNVTVTDAGNCAMSISATISEPPVLVLNAVPAPALCFGENSGSIAASATGGSPSYTFSITQDGTNFTYSTTGQFANLLAGTYSTLVADQMGCTKTIDITVTEPTQLTDLVTAYEPSCYHYSNGVIVVNAMNATPGYTFSLSDGQVNTIGIFYGLAADDYDVTITDANGCSITDFTTVTQPDSVLVTVNPSPTEVKLGDVMPIVASTNQSQNVTYQWTPSFGLSCNDCAEPVFDGVYSQVYTVTAVNDSGCVGTSTFQATVIPVYDVFFPNAITPNGDGANDTWQIFGNLKALKQLEIQVFDRIGEMVYQTNDIDFKWDPMQTPYKGKPLMPGVYVYQAKLVWMDNHIDSHYIGSLTVLK